MVVGAAAIYRTPVVLLVEVLRGIFRISPGVSRRGLSSWLASAIGRHSSESLYSANAIWDTVSPRTTRRFLVLSLDGRGVSFTCCSIVHDSRKLTVSLARSGIPAGLKRLNSSLRLSRTSHGSMCEP